ncbi:ABC transporter ATP-binding protein [Streptomyces sp. TRM 70361]|uniref:ABC transporter ATP-binding protein n=1 Tax=Streptomyces sp. TRM 70361 TaxID=3116553 RepID=UPI002E7AEC46|nr:ABC transporter ATP-binding protein [Streptomyces sp. TRM 70361]MEE1942424.1 ABC transporter ATP-binding protein [Streptomyces sp. TRM 70361]
MSREDATAGGGAGGAGRGGWALRLTDVHRRYGKGDAAVAALDGVSAGFAPGTFTALMGPSGSGKSTFLHCAAGLDRPTSGRVELAGRDLAAMSETELTKLRRERIGFVFQAFNLLPALTVEQNVTLPLRFSGRRADRELVAETLARVGLADRARHLPAQLSGGQQQRVAIARALVVRPAVLFGDEPTGALDTRTAAEVLTLLRTAVDRAGQTVVMVTHDPVAASYADRVLFLADGRLVDEMRAPTADAVAERMTSLGAWGEQARQRAGGAF